MLLIARRPGESILVGPEIEVKIVHASRSRVMVAVIAPRELKIWRQGARNDTPSPVDPQTRVQVAG